MFEERVRERPEAVAACCGDQWITYRQLNDRANRLARLLRDRRAMEPDTPVAILQNRSPDVLVSILAVLKAGGAYLPIDPAYPDERVTFMLGDSAVGAVLTDEALSEHATALIREAGLRDTSAIAVDAEATAELLAGYPATDVAAETGPGHLAYIIYTSGTTGQPKGVMVEHRSVLNYVYNAATHLGMSPDTVAAYSTGLSFDLTVTTTLACLALGGNVAVYEGELEEPGSFRRFLKTHEVSLVKLTPSYFSLIADSLPETGVATVVLGGEKLSRSILDKLDPRPGRPLTVYDEYGPTEATVGATLSRVSPSPPAKLHIGKLYHNCKAYVLGPDGEQVPVGEVGELFIGGGGLARGYLNRPDLTSERFLPNPFRTASEAARRWYGEVDFNSRIYRTGDLVRWLPDGNLEYLGRNDLQVKLRGYRVEVEEVERCLEQHGDVVQAVVEPVTDASGAVRGLAAYVLAGEFGCSDWELEQYLGRYLPTHMLPQAYVFLETMPLTANGKLDRAALPSPAQAPADDYVAPRTEVEQFVCDALSGVLHIAGARVGTTDDFVTLGGDSIVAIQLVARVRQAFGVQVPVAEVLKRGTLDKLCGFIESLRADAAAPTVRTRSEAGSLTGEVPLVPIQKWFFDSRFARSHHFNQAFLVRTPRLDVDRLRRCVRELALHHDAFRLRFRQREDGSAYQWYADDFVPTELVVASMAGRLELSELLTSWQSDFDLAAGPTYRIGYIEGFEDGSARIFVACHHLIVDAISWRILAEDLRTLYTGGELGAAGSSYRQWAEAVDAYPGAHPRERSYWQEALSDYARTGDRALRDLIASEDTRSVSGFELDVDTTRRLLREGNRAYRTQINDLLLTAFGHALREVTDGSIHHIILEGHGREEITPSVDVTRTVGWFTTMFPVRLEALADHRASLVATKEVLRALPARGIGYGAIVGYDNDQLPRVNFNYLGQFGKEEWSADSGWHITGEPAGEASHGDNHDHNIITVNGRVVDGRLGFHLVSKLNQENGDRLAECFMNALTQLAGDLAGLDRVYLTPWDVGNVVSSTHLAEIQRDREVDDVYLANSLQEGFIYHALVHDATDDAYVVQMVWSYRTAIEPEMLREAWHCAQQKFESLRLRFSWQEELVQIVDRQGVLDWRPVDLSHEPGPSQETALRRIREADRREPYALGGGSMFRVYLVKRGPEHYTCVFSSHHAILDGWSNTVLLNYVHETYQNLRHGAPVDASSDGSYAAGQSYLQEHRHDHMGFWRSYLSQYHERMDLQGLLSAAASERGVRVNEIRRMEETQEARFTVSGDLYHGLRRVAREHGVTSNALLLYLWHKVLRLYSRGDQTITGLVLAGRGIPVDGIAQSVGLFINTLPSLMHHADPAESVLDGVAAVQQQINEFHDRSNVNLSSLHEGSGRLFDTLFIYENWPKPDPDGWRTHLDSAFEGEYEKLDYPLAVVVSEADAQLDFRLVYAAEHFDSIYMDEIVRAQRHLLEQVVANPRRSWREVQFLDQTRREQVLAVLNPPSTPLAADSVFHRVFEEQVARTPDRVAVVCRDERLTYYSLNRRANQLADVLIREQGLSPGQLVVLCMDKGLDLLVSVLAVGKAGAAYVPLDPRMPDVRMTHILADTGAEVVLSTSEYRRWLEKLTDGTGADVVALDAAELGDAVAAARADNSGIRVAGSDLMYVIYTSGTTGVPKGVMIEHRSFSLVVAGVRDRHFGHCESPRTYSVTNHVFDIFGLEFGLPLTTGGCVELAVDLPDALDCRDLDFIQMTPSVCDLLLDRLAGFDDTLLLIGGEELRPELLGRILAKPLDVVNVYGPTETTIWSTSRTYRCAEPLTGRTVGLGAPFHREEIYVFDECQRPVPVGATGELYLGGGGLARGYLNDPALTAQRFVANPLRSQVADVAPMLYRTGDLVRLLADGELQFIGRTDWQVKIRGHRVELGEVESTLAAQPGVEQCVVTVQGSALVGYFVAAHRIDQPQLRGRLSASLPGHMLPGALVQLDAMPLTINGKLDRSALPAPDYRSSATFTPPSTSLEGRVCGIIAAVLGRAPETVGVDDDFFHLGGNSILSIKLVAALRRQAGLQVRVSLLLEHRSVRDLLQNLEGRDEYVEITASPELEPAEQLLSFAQERLWFIEKFEDGTSAYNIPLLFVLSNDVDPETLAQSMRDVLHHHEILRTLLREGPDGSTYQVVQSMEEIPAGLEQTRVATVQDVYGHLGRDSQRVFDLGRELPVRARIYEVAEEAGRRYLSVIVHHIAFDGWSTDILMQDLTAYYAANAGARAAAIPGHRPPRPSLQYRDFALWQRGHLSGERDVALRRFWEDKLQGFQNLDLLADQPRPERPDYRGANVFMDVDTDVSRRLRELSQELRVSLFSVLLSAYYLTLRCFSRQEDIVVGTPVANRDHPQLERLIGFFVNTLPIRSHIDPAAAVVDYIRATARDVLELLQHQELPFERLIDVLDVPRDASRHPVYQVAFGVQSFGAQTGDAADGPQQIFQAVPEAGQSNPVARFDLSTFIDDSREPLRVNLNFATSIYATATIESLGETYLEILRQFADLVAGGPVDHLLRIADLRYLSPQRFAQVVHGWSGPRDRPRADSALHELFEHHAARSPERTALVWKGRRHTYQELNEAANQLAHHLSATCGLEPNDLVLLNLDRTDYLVIAILATLKAGAAYVPVEPTYPDERIAFVMRDSAPRAVITHRQHRDRLHAIIEGLGAAGGRAPGTAPELFAIDDPDLQARLESEPSENPVTGVTLRDFAYVLYTSGTTGRPKGVPQSHGNVVRLFRTTEHVYQLQREDVWTLFHSYVFDFTIWEMWGAFIYGGRLVVPSFEETRDPSLFYALCRRERVTILCQTPTAFYPFVEVALGQPEKLDDLRYVFFGGEALNVSLLTSWFERYGYRSPRLAMGYGTTETTVFTCYKIYDEGDQGSADIGRLLPDVAGYILDQQLRPLPVGAAGELFIGGAGLAEGYLNRPQLTGEKFLPNPFRDAAGTQPSGSVIDDGNARLYRSGDLVRWSPDGSLEFVGRNDFQVKVRGHRIELGEIETVLSQFCGVRQCVVVTRQRQDQVGETYLVGYYVADRPLDLDAIVDHLRAKLPEYMVPAALVYLDQLPRTVSGKLDTSALTEPELAGAGGFVAPRNDLEARVREVMAQVLGTDADKLGIHDDFFRVGGNSILSIKLVGTLARELGVDVSIASVFKHRTIAELTSGMSSSAERPVQIARLAASDETEHVLSFAQERLWFIDRYEEGTDTYNIHLFYEVAPGTDLAVLERCFRAIYQRHEILRTVIRQGPDEDYYQSVLDDQERPLVVEHIDVADRQEIATRVARSAGHLFDLTGESPFKVTFYRHKTGHRESTYVGILVHHIAFDGWSADLMLTELNAFYRHLSDESIDGAGDPADLPELTIQYRDFAAWQRRYLSGNRLSELLAYWQGRLADHEPLNLATDHPRPARFDYRGAQLTFEIARHTSLALRRLAGELGISLFSLLLAGYYLMLHAFSGQRRVVVGVPVFNRQPSQTHALIGCFVNSLAIDFDIRRGDDVMRMVRRVADRMVEAQEHQDLPFEQLVSQLGMGSDVSRHPVFQVWFDVNSFAQADSDTGVDQPGGGDGAVLRSFPLDGYSVDGESSVVAKFDLTAVINDGEDTLVGTFNYAASLFERSTVEHFARTYQAVLEQFVATADVDSAGRRSVGDLELLSSVDRDRVIGFGRGRERAYPVDRTISDLFRERAAGSPAGTAVVFGRRSLTYREVDELSDRFGAYLVEKYGVGPGQLVALCLDRGVDMVVAIMAIWKAGGAYVPIDPANPAERMAYIAVDSGSCVVVCGSAYQSRWEELLSGDDLAVLPVDSAHVQGEIAATAPITRQTRGSSRDLAYVIYTSGTTGRPNGVMIEHRSVVNHIYAISARYGIGTDSGDEVVLQLASYVWDMAVVQILLALLNGQTLLLVPDRLWLEKDEFNAYLTRHGVTHVNATPTFFKELDLGPVPSLKRLVVGGEALDATCLKRMTRDNRVKVFNEYGPTETTVSTVGHSVSDRDLAIGRPHDNTQVFVLAPDLRPLPAGAVGELFIAGAGLARGYLNQPALTAERFIPAPPAVADGIRDDGAGSTGPSPRLYRTGDLARWRPDGVLEYLSRNDQQVKMRGYRIELGEIESAIANYPGVAQSAVVARDDDSAEDAGGNWHLVAYYVAAGGVDADDLLRSLAQALPDYMMPRYLVRLAALPVTANGKLDRRALPEPEGRQLVGQATPRNDIEEEVRRRWAGTLGVAQESIGIDESFFDLGGNSILAVRLTGQMNEICDGRLRVADVFMLKTIRRLTPTLLRSGRDYRGVTALNAGTAGPRMFMVHPAQADAEVYLPLAEELEGQFRCLGIDSHYLHHPKKIRSLRGLATYYLDLIEAGPAVTGGHHLLGWSLGGQICLEIAAQLEARGHVDINVYLLDTVLTDARLAKLRDRSDFLAERQSYLERAERFGYDRDHRQRVLENLELERQLSLEPVSGRLAHTRVLLFKALMPEAEPGSQERSPVRAHVMSLASNNVDLAVGGGASLQVIPMPDANHQDILTRQRELAQAIVAFSQPANSYH